MDELVERGIREFNEGRFFEAHDILEDFWQGYRGSDRVFLQGLIQAAVGFYHLEHRNFEGASSQLTRASVKIEAFRPEYWGLAVDLLHGTLLRHLRFVEMCRQDKMKGGELLERPRIQFSSDNHQDNVQKEETS